MTKQERRIAKEITRRLRQYEDYLDGTRKTISKNCRMCLITRVCLGCPFQCNPCTSCHTEKRHEFAGLCGETDNRPHRAIVLARYKELLKIIKKNGWRYD